MKKIFLLSIIFLFLLISISYAEINISGCPSNLFNTSNMIITECSPDPLADQRNCSKLIDFNLTFADNVWQTELASPIPPNDGIAVLEPATSGETISFSTFEMYIVPHPTDPQNPPRDFTLEAFKNGVWETILNITNFYNDTESCRGADSTIGLGVSNPLCNSYPVTVFDAEKIRLNVTEVECAPPCSNQHLIISEIMACGTPVEACEFPLLFCDRFNYIAPISTRGWLAQEGGGIINTSFTPIDETLLLQGTNRLFPSHLTDAFPTSYRPDSGTAFTQHFMSPVFSTEFELTISNETDNEFRYASYEKQFRTAYILRGLVNNDGNITWFFANQTQPSLTWETICENCSQAGELLTLKINSFFAQRDEFPFNSSVDVDTTTLYVNGKDLGSINIFLSPVNFIAQYDIIKIEDANFTVDDYFVMVGTDKLTATHTNYYNDIFDNRSVIVTDYGGGTGDFAEAVSTIWDDMGLKSAASKIMTGIFLMFFLALIMFGVSMKSGNPVSARVIMIIELFFMIFLTYIKLLPLWIPFVVVIVTAVLGGLAIKMGTET